MNESAGFVESKIGPDFLKVNVAAVVRRVFKGRTEEQVLLVRFRHLVTSHGLRMVQLLRLVPPEFGLKAGDLQNDSRLLDVLNDQMLAWTAAVFGVRREWLEGQDDQIYPPLWGYKCLNRLFEELVAQGLMDYNLQLFLLHEKGSIPTRLSTSYQPVVLAFAHPIIELDEKLVRRFLFSRDSWNYGHFLSRIHLKAIARLFYKAFPQNTLLVPMPPYQLCELREGKTIPSGLPQGSGGCELFEAYALSDEESTFAQETEELPAVLDFINKHGYARHFPGT